MSRKYFSLLQISNTIACFVLCFFAYLSNAQELTLYIYPAPAGMNWESPNKLLSSYAKNSVCAKGGTKRHAMGHVVVELKDEKSYALVGAAAENNYGMSSKVLSEGYGFGAFYYGFKGRLQEADVNLPDLEPRLAAGEAAYIRIKLGRENFTRLQQYLKEYKERGYDRIYNGKNRPLYGGGAGCSAFGISFLEVAELPLKEMTDQWIVSVAIPHALIGGPEGNGLFVPLGKIMLTGKWADTTKQAYRMASYYDPTMMYNSIVKAHDEEGFSGGVKEMKAKAKGFFFDFSNAAPVRTPIWPSDQKQIQPAIDSVELLAEGK
jgi:hypothetical protein